MSNKNDNQWPHLPLNVQGIDYDLIDKISNNNIFSEIDEILSYINDAKKFIENYNSGNKNTQNSQTVLDSNPINNFYREAPPFNVPCVYSSEEGCVKKAAFKHKVDGAYCCWFHINFYKPQNI